MTTNVDTETTIVRTSRDLGVAVRRARTGAGWSQSDLAAKAGVSRAWLVAFEAGKPTVELDRVLRTVEALGIRLAIRTSEDPAFIAATAALSGILEDLQR